MTRGEWKQWWDDLEGSWQARVADRNRPGNGANYEKTFADLLGTFLEPAPTADASSGG